jgi:hypothetical protein
MKCFGRYRWHVDDRDRCFVFVEKEGLSRRRVCREGGFVEKEGLSRRRVCREGCFVEMEVLSRIA